VSSDPPKNRRKILSKPKPVLKVEQPLHQMFHTDKYIKVRDQSFDVHFQHLAPKFAEGCDKYQFESDIDCKNIPTELMRARSSWDDEKQDLHNKNLNQHL